MSLRDWQKNSWPVEHKAAHDLSHAGIGMAPAVLSALRFCNVYDTILWHSKSGATGAPQAANRSRSGCQTLRIGQHARTSWRGLSGSRQATSEMPSFLRDGVSELRIDWGPGYRVYFGREGRTVIVLLCGGDKRNQGADIRKAVELWQEYANRRKGEPRSKH